MSRRFQISSLSCVRHAPTLTSHSPRWRNYLPRVLGAGGVKHAVRRRSDPGVRPGAAGRPGRHRGDAAAQLEGERERVEQHHDPHLSDAGSVGGLRVVQLRRLQLHHEGLGAVAAAVAADDAGRHGSVLHGGGVWALPRLAGAQMHPVGGQPSGKGPHGDGGGRLLRSGQPALPGSGGALHQRGHHRLPDHRPAGQQQVPARRRALRHLHRRRVPAGRRSHLLSVLSRKRVLRTGQRLKLQLNQTGKEAGAESGTQTEEEEKRAAADG